MGKYVIRSGEKPAFSPGGHIGAVNRILINAENEGAAQMEVVLGVVSAEGGTEAHSHDIEQAQYMLAGRAYVEVDGEGEEVQAGDIMFFPPGKVHRISPVGGEYQSLIIYAPPRRS